MYLFPVKWQETDVNMLIKKKMRMEFRYSILLFDFIVKRMHATGLCIGVHDLYTPSRYLLPYIYTDRHGLSYATVLYIIPTVCTAHQYFYELDTVTFTLIGFHQSYICMLIPFLV